MASEKCFRNFKLFTFQSNKIHIYGGIFMPSLVRYLCWVVRSLSGKSTIHAINLLPFVICLHLMIETHLELTGSSEFNTQAGIANCSRNNFNLKYCKVIIMMMIFFNTAWKHQIKPDRKLHSEITVNILT